MFFWTYNYSSTVLSSFVKIDIRLGLQSRFTEISYIHTYTRRQLTDNLSNPYSKLIHSDQNSKHNLSNRSTFLILQEEKTKTEELSRLCSRGSSFSLRSTRIAIVIRICGKNYVVSSLRTGVPSLRPTQKCETQFAVHSPKSNGTVCGPAKLVNPFFNFRNFQLWVVIPPFWMALFKRNSPPT